MKSVALAGNVVLIQLLYILVFIIVSNSQITKCRVSVNDDTPFQVVSEVLWTRARSSWQ